MNFSGPSNASYSAWPICADFMRWERPWLAYSVGIADDWRFDDALAALDFEVHAFDPTKQFKERHVKHAVSKVHFYPWGLTGESYGTRLMKSTYGDLEGPLLSLSSLRERLGHRGPMHVLKIDCEGCEWDAFYGMAHRTPTVLADVSVLMIEVHLTAARTKADLAKLAAFHDYVFEEMGFRLWFRRPNPCQHKTALLAGFAFAKHSFWSCYELGFYRPLATR